MDLSASKFSRFNSRRYANELYHYTLEGKESSSGEIMYEISNSIERIVEATSSIKGQKKATEYQAYAYDIILMLGDKRLCKVAATSHPVLIIKLFDALNTTNIAKLPISDFCRNVSTSLIVSDESLLRYESDFISSGLLGELKPLSKAMFGNMQKLECLGVNFGSPLDLQFSRGKLSGIQLETYCRCLSVAVDSYLSDELWKQHSYVLNRAFHFLDSQTFGIHEINLNPDGYFELEAYKRFETVADFLTTLLNALDERKGIEGIVRYCRESHIDKQSNSKDIFDLLAELAFELSHKSAYINVRSDVCWWVQHNIIWAPLVSDIRQGSARTMVLEKYFGLLEKEIFWREGWLNFKSARLLGFSLNMLGVSLEENTEGKPYHQFRSRILEWSKSHYETVRKNQFDVADAVLFGSITYEEGYLVKTYAKGLKSKAPYELLELDDHE
ncbi:hypothetical protein JCM19233_234 [Vibrio astriarenae]|nr:hypothetical protein JCM19233_234 [Vibrio sp. C7]